MNAHRPELLAAVAGAASRVSGDDDLALLAAQDAERVQLATTRGQLLATLRVRPGMRVLELGAGGGALTRALADAGAAVTAVEPDAALAELARVRCADVEGVRVVVGDGHALPPEATGFDLVIIAPIAGVTALADAGGPSLEAIIGWGAARLAASGVMAVAVDNPWGMAALLEAPDALTEHPRQRPGPLQGAPGHAGLAARATLDRLFDGLGLVQHRTWGVYPDRVAPRAIVAETLYADPGAPGLLAAFVREPVGRPATGTVLLRDPSRVLREATEAGLGFATAPALLVVAGRRSDDLAVATRPGALFLLSGPEKGRPWRRTRTLDRGADGGWALAPVGPVPEVVSGPLRLRERDTPVVLGTNGEDLVMDVLLAHGPGDERTSDLLQTWWEAAEAIVSAPDEGGWHFDVAPRNFIVDAGGSWRFVDRELTMADPVPPAVAAWRAVLFTLADRVLPLGVLPGVDPSRTVGEVTTDLLEPLAIAADSAAQEAWIAFESDLQHRVRPAIASPEAEAAALRTILARRVGEWAGCVPLDRLLEAVRCAERGRSASDAEAAAARDELGASVAALATVEERLRAAEEQGRAAVAALAQAEATRTIAIADQQAAERRAGESEAAARAAAARADESDAAARAAAIRASRPGVLRAVTAIADRVRRRGLGGANPLFDAPWYLERYADVRAAGTDPWRHYVRRGAAEGRDPNSWFDTDWYLATYPDVAASSLDPLGHYLRFGLAEGRRPNGRQTRAPERERPPTTY